MGNPSIANPCGFTKCIDPDTGKKCKLAVAAVVGEEPKIYKNCGEVFPQEENPGCFTECKRRVEEFDTKAEKKRQKKKAAKAKKQAAKDEKRKQKLEKKKQQKAAKKEAEKEKAKQKKEDKGKGCPPEVEAKLAEDPEACKKHVKENKPKPNKGKGDKTKPDKGDGDKPKDGEKPKDGGKPKPEPKED